MESELRNALRNLCLNAMWKYAVFWKLNYDSRSVLTLEDAYYENYQHCDSLEDKSCRGKVENFLGGIFQHEQLGLAVAKMSYHVYSFGEGLVGHVAATGKHLWITADNLMSDSFSPVELSDGWHIQFSSGIRTIVVIAVLPYGALQLGSLNEVAEDMNFVGHVRDAFLNLQDFSFGCSLKSSFCLTTHEEVNKHEMHQASTLRTDESEKLSHSRSNISYMENQKQVIMNLVSNQILAESNFWKDQDRATVCNVPPRFDSGKVNKTQYDLPGLRQRFGPDLANLAVNVLGSSVCDMVETNGVSGSLNGATNQHESSSMTGEKEMGDKLVSEAQTSHFGDSNPFMMFSAGYELHEALGPPFLKRYMYSDCEQEKFGTRNVIEMPEVISSSKMTFNTCSDSLLEAVVSNSCHSGSDVISEKSVCKSVRFPLTTERRRQPLNQRKGIVDSAGYAINHSFVKYAAQCCSNSIEVCGAFSARGLSSSCLSSCSEQLHRHSEAVKNNKKRARPGESCRPRPRDRQLIQDRIKELRELVPNASKCSIDSLLERTTKLMLFLESITKHADKLNQCTELKMHQRGIGTCDYDQGSSWAVEVGGHLKVSSIVVENVNKNGQMLVELLCEECSHFLEIAEAIRGLGLTILKGVSELQGDKTWICFVVEGVDNRNVHRMDILWSLVQILQPKTRNGL